MTSPSPFDKLIARFARTSDLSPSDVDAIRSLPCNLREYGRNADLVREGDRPSQCCLVVEGYLCRFNVVQDGSRQMLSFPIAGDLPDACSLSLAALDHNIATLTPSVVAFIPHHHILRLMANHPRVATCLWRDTLIEAAIFRQWIVNVGRREGQDRVAHLLC